MYKRLISFNKYPRSFIFNKTGIRPESSIVCVGNTFERRELEREIVEGRPVIVRGYGKMTAVMEIIDRLDLKYLIDYSGNLFDISPLYTRDIIYVIRYKEGTALLAEYAINNVRMVILSEEGCNLGNTKIITLKEPTSIDKAEYKKLKGEEMQTNDYKPEIKTEEQQVIRCLREGIILERDEDLLETLDLWYAYNFKDPTILKLCSLASQSKNLLWKAEILNKIRYRNSFALKRPPNLMKYQFTF